MNLTFDCIALNTLVENMNFIEKDKISFRILKKIPLDTSNQCTSTNPYVNIQFTKFISPCFNQGNIRPLSSKTDLNCLLYFNLLICSRLSGSIGIVLVFESFFKKVCRDNTVCILLLLLL